MFFDFLKLLYTRTGEHILIDRGAAAFDALFAGGTTWKQITATILFLIELPFALAFDVPMTSVGPELDLTGYEMVFCDEFEGDTLNTDIWYHRGEGARAGGYFASSQVDVHDGNLVISGEYLENGMYGSGWYGATVGIKEKYTRGYFEIRCICSKGEDFWSAFWIQADHPYDPEISKGGVGGAEIDIFEAMDYDNLILRNSVLQTIHCSGMQGDTSGGLNSASICRAKANDIYNEYNVYGCEWTEDEYIFYVNGVESARTSFADGVSQVPEEVLVSLCVPNEFEETDTDFKCEFIVDYVKIYQKASGR